MYFRILFLTLIFHVGFSSASELTVYRWVDENNVVHFSQHQPINDEYTEFLVSNQSEIKSRADAKVTSSVSNEKVSSEKDETNIPSSIDMSANCKEAKENLAMLLAFDNVQFTDNDGIKQILNKREKKQQIEINKKRTEVYCAPKNEE
jgi:hypothetical protein